MPDRTPHYGFPVRDRDGVTIGWAWRDPADPDAVSVRDDRWEIVTRHPGPLARITAEIACLARSRTDTLRIALHLHELVETIAKAQAISAEAEVLRTLPATAATTARAQELGRQVDVLIARRDEIAKLCRAEVQ